MIPEGGDASAYEAQTHQWLFRTKSRRLSARDARVALTFANEELIAQKIVSAFMLDENPIIV